MRVLITGFEPFGGREVNRSRQVAESFDTSSGSLDVMILPVSFGKSHKMVLDRLSKEHYDLIIMLGETAATSDYIRLERFAHNFKDSSSSDNDGITANEDPLVPGGPMAYLTKFPVKQVCHDLKNSGHRITVSNSAGTFVCNSLYYHVLRYIEENKLLTEALFVHLPVSTTQVSLDEMKAAINAIISDT